MPDDLPYVDTHTVLVQAPTAQVWPVLHDYASHLGVTAGAGSASARTLGLVLGPVPASGFEVAEEVPGRRMTLVGRHRFSRYRLVFELEADPGQGTLLHAHTYAVFPGPHGAAYRLLVIRSRLHVVATRAMLRSVQARVVDA